MPPRKTIPIASQGQQRPAPTTFQSSLDIVFSFSRSQAFFGENLPGEPSFVDRVNFRRPGQDDESSIAPSASDDREETSDEEWSGDELDEQGIQSWDTDEQLPSNAVGREARRSRRSRGSARPFSQSDSSVPSDLPYSHPSTNSSHLLPPTSASAPDERSPLISNRLSPTSISDTGRPGRGPQQLRAANLSDHTKQQGFQDRPSNRRLSIISSEVWQAAVEENRGKSTYGQTLFNT